MKYAYHYTFSWVSEPQQVAQACREMNDFLSSYNLLKVCQQSTEPSHSCYLTHIRGEKRWIQGYLFINECNKLEWLTRCNPLQQTYISQLERDTPEQIFLRESQI